MCQLCVTVSICVMYVSLYQYVSCMCHSINMCHVCVTVSLCVMYVSLYKYVSCMGVVYHLAYPTSPCRNGERCEQTGQAGGACSHSTRLQSRPNAQLHGHMVTDAAVVTQDTLRSPHSPMSVVCLHQASTGRCLRHSTHHLHTHSVCKVDRLPGQISRTSLFFEPSSKLQPRFLLCN